MFRVIIIYHATLGKSLYICYVFFVFAATLASGDVDLCLVPESDIVLDGPKGCLPHVLKRVSHTVRDST